MTLVSLMTASLTACQTADGRLAAAGRTQADARLVEQALEAGRDLPPLPADCRKAERSGVRDGDRLDVALVKTDQALGRANARVRRCAAWHDGLRKAEQ